MDTLIIQAGTRSWEQLHDQVGAWPGAPSWYGRNLDALRDVLVSRPAAVVLLEDAAALVARLDGGDRLVAVLVDAAKENPRLAWVWGAAPQGETSIGV